MQLPKGSLFCNPVKMKQTPPPFQVLRWVSAVLFLLSLAAMVCAGLIYADILALEARVSPATWEVMVEDKGLPQGLHFALSIMACLSLALLAAVIYVGAALSERLLASR